MAMFGKEALTRATKCLDSLLSRMKDAFHFGDAVDFWVASRRYCELVPMFL